MPSIQAFWKATKDKNLVIMAVSEGEKPSTVSSFVKSKGYTYPFYLDEASVLGGQFGVQGIPTTFVFDKNGMVIARVVGGRAYDSPEVLALFSELAAASPAR
jgi:peroxiredoxin